MTFPPLAKNKTMAGFALVELMSVLVIVALLSTLWTHFRASVREAGFVGVDFANMRRILQASEIYAAENNDFLAHPTWGQDLTGPDGWAYATSNHLRPVPGALSATPGSCAGFDVNSKQFTNQLAYFRAGQITQHLPSLRSAWCPKDVQTRESGTLRRLWLGRPMKVTSYVWNGSIGGYTGPRAANLISGKTFKRSVFKPGDVQMWEQNETDPFYFGDAGNNPASPGESLSLRHSGLMNWWSMAGNNTVVLPGGGVIGTFDGGAQMMNFAVMNKLVTGRIPAPNAFLNGPGYAP